MVVIIDSQIAGISGDMLLSALVSLGADKSKIIDGIRFAEKFLTNTNLKHIDFELTKKHGTQATTLSLELDENFHQRKGIEMKNCIEKSISGIKLSQKAKQFALHSIDTLISSESKIHGESLTSVHFHEASSFDTIVDILGSAIALDDLKFFDDEIISTPVAIGGGTITFSHGTTSNPAGAILEIFRNSGISILGGQIKEELTTPTGASMLVNLTTHCLDYYPPMKINKIGYGAGKKDFDEFSNVLKIVVGEKVSDYIHDSVKVLETNVDDVSGELLGNMIDKIMESGAKDVTISSGITKKGRPTNLVSIICDSKSMNEILDILISETGTLGVRVRTSERFTIPRSIKTIPISIKGKKFNIRFKHAKGRNLEKLKIEFDDIKQISDELNKSFREAEDLIKNELKNMIDNE